MNVSGTQQRVHSLNTAIHKQSLHSYMLPTLVSKSKCVAPLIVEAHPVEYSGFPFITLIQYKKQPMLAIIDNVTESEVRAFVLDLCGPEHIDETLIMAIAQQWYNENKSNYPLSVEFSKRNVTSVTTRIYRVLNIEFISRIIGPAPKYPLTGIRNLKRRRRKASTGYTVEGNVLQAEQLF